MSWRRGMAENIERSPGEREKEDAQITSAQCLCNDNFITHEDAEKFIGLIVEDFAEGRIPVLALEAVPLRCIGRWGLSIRIRRWMPRFGSRFARMVGPPPQPVGLAASWFAGGQGAAFGGEGAVGDASARCVGSGEIAVVGAFVEDFTESEVKEVECAPKFGREGRRG